MSTNIDALLEQIDGDLRANQAVRREAKTPYPMEEVDSLLGRTVEVLRGMGVSAIHGAISESDPDNSPDDSPES